MSHRARSLIAASAAALALSGCATSYVLDNQVQAFAGAPALAAPLSYRFERLPSQAANPAHTELEAAADAALHGVGLRRDDAAPRYSVQLTARVQRAPSPWSEPWHGWGGSLGWGRRSRYWGLSGNFHRMEQPWFEREVGVIVRELATTKVIFESRAGNHGPSLEPRAVLAAMFQAAMQGFPNPPPGPRQIDVPLRLGER